MDPLTPLITALEHKVTSMMPALVHKAGATALLFIHENFQKQGFQGATLEPWEPRDPDTRPGKPILIKTGHLQNSPFISSETGNSVTITSNLPYSQIHNEGGTINHPAREVILNFSKTPEHALWTFGKVRTITQQMGIKAIRRATIPAHTTTMKKRQFMGPSPILDKRIQDNIEAALKALSP